jgi:transcriptional regulator with XRE-family HTH domain
MTDDLAYWRQMHALQRARDVERTAQRLNLIRRAKGLSHKEMARLLSITPARWSSYINGARTCDPYVAVRLCQLVGVSLDFIYWGRVDEYTPEDVQNQIFAEVSVVGRWTDALLYRYSYSGEYVRGLFPEGIPQGYAPGEQPPVFG